MRPRFTRLAPHGRHVRRGPGPRNPPRLFRLATPVPSAATARTQDPHGPYRPEVTRGPPASPRASGGPPAAPAPPPASTPGPALQWRQRLRRPDRHVLQNLEASATATAARASPPHEARPRARPSLLRSCSLDQVPPPRASSWMRLVGAAISLCTFPYAP